MLSVSSRKSMNIEKNKYSNKQRQQAGMTTLSKIVIFVTALLLFITLSFYLKYSSGPTDKSEIYNVKILPADLDDPNLSKLDQQVFSYLAIIDAGSSGCRAHVYRYGKLGTQQGPLYVLPQHQSFKVKPGLSSFASTPSAAGESLTGLITFMKSQIPENLWSDTPVWLKATAGLRLLDKVTAESILLSVKKFLSTPENSPFIFKSNYAAIISGREEGGFGWIAYNYLKKVIGPKKTGNVLPYAVVEMGGASTQVSQLAPSPKEAAKIPEQYKYSFTIQDETFHLYTYSYLGFGAEQAREGFNKLLLNKSSNEKILRDPCLYSGYFRDTPRKEIYEGPSGNFIVHGESKSKSCVDAVSKLFATEKTCDEKVGPFSFNCLYQPSFVQLSANFLIFENYYYVSSAIGVKSAIEASPIRSTSTRNYPLVTTPLEFKNAAFQVCNSSWIDMQSNYPLDDQSKDNNIKWCFSASYATQFLLQGIKLPEDKRVTIQKYVDDSEIEWALGAAYKEASDFLKKTTLRSN